MMFKKFFKRNSSAQELDARCENALRSATLNPRYHKTHQQLCSRFLNAYVRYMFDSINLAKEIQLTRHEGEVQLAQTLKTIIGFENEAFHQNQSDFFEVMIKILTEKTHQACNDAMHEAKRKSHQFSQLAQSVMKDQRNNLLLSKTMMMAKRYGQASIIHQLASEQRAISPADAFAAKLLNDSEYSSKSDNIDVLCFTSLAEGIRSVATSQMNHYFQMRRFEKEQEVKSFNGVSSEEIIQQLQLDKMLINQYDALIEMESYNSSHLRNNDYRIADDELPNLH